MDWQSRALSRIVSLRIPIAAAFAVLVPLAALRAARIPSQGGIERLIVRTDPDAVATGAFEHLFPDSPTAVLLFESDDPWSPASLERVEAAEREVRNVPHVSAFSVLDAVRRARPGAPGETLRKLADLPFFREQGLLGDRFLSVMADLDVKSPGDRDGALRGIDAALERAGAGQVRKVGSPYVEAWLEQQSGAASARYMPFFGALVVAVSLLLYRSVRALFALILALGAAVALGVAAGGLCGFSFTIVSVLVPLTILVTTLANLVYLHSRFVDRPAEVPVAEHQIHALRNKLLPVSVSTFAAVLGFGALAISPIRPVRELGTWTALGLAISWVVSFTLFPALQSLLRTPTRPAREEQIPAFAAAIPRFTFRHRKLLVATALVLSAAGAVATFGIPGRLPPMSVVTDTLSYIDPSLQLRQDLVWFREHAGDLNVAHVWVHLSSPSATDPRVLQAVDRFQGAVEGLPRVRSVVGPTTFLHLRRLFAGQDDRLPSDPAQFARAAADLEQLLLAETGLRGYIDPNGLADLQLTVIFEQGDAAGYAALSRSIGEAWTAQPLPGAQMKVVGRSLLQTKVGASLVPTLAQSFLLTAVLIFAVFLFVFRSGTARALAMIPSVFAILVTFLCMRLFGASLNLATVLIATIVLGTTENDQIHFFHHLHERHGAPLGQAMEHALAVAGRAMAFATLVNMAGFLALSFSSFPPLRQFGLVTSGAFLLALAADFTALPAGLWLLRRQLRGVGATADIDRQ
ncbi:MAG TPA: MMPL family transporter [Myxococcales bacterium]|nr:MMPL family transporter [Myxococcales bacterium]